MTTWWPRDHVSGFRLPIYSNRALQFTSQHRSVRLGSQTTPNRGHRAQQGLVCLREREQYPRDALQTDAQIFWWFKSHRVLLRHHLRSNSSSAFVNQFLWGPWRSPWYGCISAMIPDRGFTWPPQPSCGQRTFWLQGSRIQSQWADRDGWQRLHSGRTMDRLGVQQKGGALAHCRVINIMKVSAVPKSYKPSSFQWRGGNK